MPAKLLDIQKDINFQFNDKKLLKNAFVHRSYLNEHKDYKGPSNERLEFLGDSILSLIVSRFLYEKLPKSTEGRLTQIRASLVRTETLAKLAKSLKLGNYLYLSKGEEDSGGRINSSILANCFEALVGAIFIYQGIEKNDDFLKKMILVKWQTLAKSAVSDNKSKLQEFLHPNYNHSPTYRLQSSWGPDHARIFEIGVYLEEKLLGKGVGKNKQEAAQNAAESALARLKG